MIEENDKENKNDNYRNTIKDDYENNMNNQNYKLNLAYFQLNYQYLMYLLSSEHKT